MSDNRTSPTILKKPPLKSRRKLPFSENITTPSDLEVCKEDCSDSSRDSTSLTPRRSAPLSERQQIALLCRLSGTSSTESSPVTPVSEVRRNERGETPLHLATIKGDYRRVQFLLKKGAEANTPDYAGWTPLHEACNYGWYKIAKLLIEFEADVNAVGLDKFTPLHDAAVNAHEDIVKLLLKNGADPLKKNANQRTPLDLAKTERISDLLKTSIDSQQPGNLSGVAREVAAAQSPCPTYSCDLLTMRRNSPQNTTQKGAEKPTSPRLTLRFQSIKPSRDDKSAPCDQPPSSSSQHKYASYCVTMETKGEAVTSTTSVDNVTSTSEEAEVKATVEERQEEEAAVEPSEASSEKMDTSEPPSKVNGGRLSVDSSNSKDCPPSTDLEKEEGRRKRRRSNDSAQSNRSKGGGHKSPSSKSSQSGSPKMARKRGSQSSSDTESNPSDADVTAVAAGGEEPPNAFAQGGGGPHSPKVPPLKIVIPSGSGSLEQLETRERSKVSSSKQALPYVVNTTSADTVVDNSTANDSSASDKSELTTTPSKPTQNDGKKDSEQPEEKFQRVTRSSQRMQAAMSSSNSKDGGDKGASSENVVSSSSSGSQKGEEGESSNDEQMQVQMDVHPRKRKLRTRESENGSQNPSSASSSNEDSQQQQTLLNSYQMFQNIRKQVDKRRKGMVCRVQPKVPHGFKDYLINRGAYVLYGNPASRLSVPMITPPQSLDGPIKELFLQQEKERYQLRLQHLIQREKLVLSVEQEILRVHGQSARAMANQSVPLSACSVLKDGEIYNVLEDDKDKNSRTRYNGRLLLSWLQDVDDKWKKIKENMLLRHHNEAESLHAVQRLDWEWKMKELGMCDRKTTPVIDDIFVPIVHVNDEFNTLSACQ